LCVRTIDAIHANAHRTSRSCPTGSSELIRCTTYTGDHRLYVGGDIRNGSVMYRRVPGFERALIEKAYPSWDSQKPVAIRTHVLLRESIARIENHPHTAAWTLGNDSLHSYASTDYFRFRRNGFFGGFLDLVCGREDRVDWQTCEPLSSASALVEGRAQYAE
jgi:hypothetical protein